MSGGFLHHHQQQNPLKKQLSEYEPRFCGVAYSFETLLDSQLFVSQVEATLACFACDKERDRLAMGSFYIRDLDSGGTILHLVADKGLRDVAEYLLKLLTINPLCPPSTPPSNASATSLLKLLDLGFSNLNDDTIKSLPHPLSMTTLKEKTALMLAVEKAHAGMVKLFVSHGVDVNQCSSANGAMGTTNTLANAVRSDKADMSEIIQILLSAKDIEVDIADYNPIYLAAQINRPDYVQILYEVGGADINKTPSGECLLASVHSNPFNLKHMYPLAPEFGSQIYDYLLSLAEPTVPKDRRLNIFARSRQTSSGLLHNVNKYFMPKCFVERVLLLADRTVSPSPLSPPCGLLVEDAMKRAGGAAQLLAARDSLGNTPLILAIEAEGDLLSLGAYLDYPTIPTIHMKNRSGTTPLLACISKMTTSRAALDATSSPHHWLSALLAHGADASAADNYGTSPLSSVLRIMATLHWPETTAGHMQLGGMHGNQAESIKFTQLLAAFEQLLSSGADITTVDPSSGRTLGHEVIANGIDEATVQKVLEMLFAEGLPVDAKDAEGLTLVHQAAKMGFPTLIQSLASRCDIREVHQPSGKSLAHLLVPSASVRPNYSMHSFGYGQPVINPFSTLKQLGLDLNIVDAMGNTPLHEAVENMELTKVELLVGAGCDQNLKTLTGETALELAIRRLTEYKATTQKDFQWHPGSNSSKLPALEGIVNYLDPSYSQYAPVSHQTRKMGSAKPTGGHPKNPKSNN